VHECERERRSSGASWFNACVLRVEFKVTVSRSAGYAVLGRMAQRLLLFSVDRVCRASERESRCGALLVPVPAGLFRVTRSLQLSLVTAAAPTTKYCASSVVKDDVGRIALGLLWANELCWWIT